VSVGVSIGIQPDMAALLKVVAGYVDLGYRRVKLKIEPGNDIESVRAVRNEHPALPLQVDANTAYRIEDAAMLETLDAFDLQMLEQPFAEDDMPG
jgi:O-succinylbenzoate synthase